MEPGISLLIATIPGREALLERALASAAAQTLPFADVIVQLDAEREGPAITRNKALSQVKSRYTAVLDDDDYLFPSHNSILSAALERAEGAGAGAVLAFPACAMERGGVLVEAPAAWRRRWARPFADGIGAFLGGENWIPATTVFRTEAVRGLGGFSTAHSMAEDYSMLLDLVLMHGSGALVGPGDGQGIGADPTWVYSLDSAGARADGRPVLRPG